MVGHSYGGAVISNAATGNDQVQALVFINGWVPDEGESLIGLAQLNEGSLIPDSLRPVQVKNADGSDVVDLYLDQEMFRAAFAGDVDAETAQVMAVAQRPFTETAFGAPSGPVAWRSIPSWYLLGTEDRAIPPATQRYMAERANAGQDHSGGLRPGRWREQAHARRPLLRRYAPRERRVSSPGEAMMNTRFQDFTWAVQDARSLLTLVIPLAPGGADTTCASCSSTTIRG